MGIKMTTAEIVKATGGRLATGFALSMIQSLCTDPARVEDGALFIPLETSGLQHSVDRAFRCGAITALVPGSDTACAATLKKHPKKIIIEIDDPHRAVGEIARYWRQQLRIPIALIVGAEKAAAVRHISWSITRTMLGSRTVENNDSPLSTALFLADLNADSRAAIIDAGTMNEADLMRCFDICVPDIGMVTDSEPAQSRMHTAFMQRFEKDTIIICNNDDRRALKSAEKASARTISFGTKKADIHASSTKHAKSGIVSFDLHLPDNAVQLRMTLPAGIDLSCILAAAALAHGFGLTAEAVKQGLENLQNHQVS